MPRKLLDQHTNPKALPTIGWRERVSLPNLGIKQITAKTDTGAYSSSIHAFDITEFKKEQELWIKFCVLTSRHSADSTHWCEARVVDQRKVKNSGGKSIRRYFIATIICIGEQCWEIELSLADRESMGYRMLLGRTAIRGNFLIDPRKSYLKGKPTQKFNGLKNGSEEQL
jgi:hypothetical protein